MHAEPTTYFIPSHNRRFAKEQWLLVLLLLLALLVQGTNPIYAAARTQSVSDPLVLAFYYPWFDQNTWTYDLLSDLPAEPYVSADRGVMGRQIDQAKAAGIDAFLVAWYGPGGGNQTESNLAAMLEEANARGFKIGVLFETTSPFFGGVGDVTGALQHLQSTHVNHPAFLRVDGRPVVFFWRPTIYGVDTWRSIRSQADPNYSNIWISEGVDTSYLAVFDGHHLYSNTWNPPADLNATNQKFASRVAAARDAYGASKIWVATVMPGYNDVKVRGGFARDREGGNYFAQSWSAAIASNPSWIVINSFNEWPEGSYIEPSAAFGDLFLGLSASYSAAIQIWRGRSHCLCTTSPAATPTYSNSYAATHGPTAYVNTSILNLRASPNTDCGNCRASAIRLRLTDQRARPYPTRLVASLPTTIARRGSYGPLITTGGPMEQVSTLASAATETLAQDSSDLLAATENTLDGENASIEIFSDAAVGGAQPAATFAACRITHRPTT